jgi:hypothetical protein
MTNDTVSPSGEPFARDMRRIREQNDVSRTDIHESTRIPETLIESFETSGLLDHPTFNRVYLRSFVRAYAECVGIDADLALECLDAALDDNYDGRLATRYLDADEPTAPPAGRAATGEGAATGEPAGEIASGKTVEEGEEKPSGEADHGPAHRGKDEKRTRTAGSGADGEEEKQRRDEGDASDGEAGRKSDSDVSNPDTDEPEEANDDVPRGPALSSPDPVESGAGSVEPAVGSDGESGGAAGEPSASSGPAAEDRSPRQEAAEAASDEDAPAEDAPAEDAPAEASREDVSGEKAEEAGCDGKEEGGPDEDAQEENEDVPAATNEGGHVAIRSPSDGDPSDSSDGAASRAGAAAEASEPAGDPGGWRERPAATEQIDADGLGTPRPVGEGASVADGDPAGAGQASPGAEPPGGSTRSPSSLDTPSSNWGGRMLERIGAGRLLAGMLLVLVLAVGGYLFSGEDEDTSAAAPPPVAAADSSEADSAEAPPERPPPAEVTVGATIHATLVAEENVTGLRIRRDDDLRRPYWIEGGQAAVFPFSDQMIIDDQDGEDLAAVRALLIEGHPYPLDRRGADGRLVITRDTVEAFVDTLRGAPAALEVAPDTNRIPPPAPPSESTDTSAQGDTSAPDTSSAVR